MAEQHHHPKQAHTTRRFGPIRHGEKKRLLWVTLLTGVTMVAEFIGAYATNSLALLGDAFHMLTHFGSVGMSYLAIVIALRPAPPDKTYRHVRSDGWI
ncbi:MAG: cation transporter, partial [Planctomycetota bacterium]|nr:cation transporter [Planctomycetota bacterium]